MLHAAIFIKLHFKSGEWRVRIKFYAKLIEFDNYFRITYNIKYAYFQYQIYKSENFIVSIVLVRLILWFEAFQAQFRCLRISHFIFRLNRYPNNFNKSLVILQFLKGKFWSYLNWTFSSWIVFCLCLNVKWFYTLFTFRSTFSSEQRGLQILWGKHSLLIFFLLQIDISWGDISKKNLLACTVVGVIIGFYKSCWILVYNWEIMMTDTLTPNNHVIALPGKL